MRGCTSSKAHAADVVYSRPASASAMEQIRAGMWSPPDEDYARAYAIWLLTAVSCIVGTFDDHTKRFGSGSCEHFVSLDTAARLAAEMAGYTTTGGYVVHHAFQLGYRQT